ncbi:MAG: HD-GYP domain-containing protein [Anaerolineaceae bacterium]|nr:HD-GYP domain-containing protein [Anaerolineaceae bacterium]
MRHGFIKFAKFFVDNETISRESRQHLASRAWITFSELLLVVILPILTVEYVQNPDVQHLFFLINDAVLLFIYLLLYRINQKLPQKEIFPLVLAISFYTCLTIIPIRHEEQLILNFALPTIVASFAGKRESSIVFAVCASLASVAYFLWAFPGEPFPYLAIVCLLFLAVLAYQVDLILDSMMTQVTSAYDRTIEGWSQALEMRNHETEGHSHRVAELTMQLVQKMGLDESNYVHIRRGVLLHDIGKMGVPDSILCKAGPLTDSENLFMRKHPEYAYHLLENIPFLHPALQVPFCHHEKWNGSGYPRGLKGEEIPLEARIFSVIDVWDAMRSNRSYRAAIPEAQVIEYLRCETGRSFDPAVVKAFFDMMNFDLEKEPAKLTLQQPQVAKQA